jgi:dUTP pyrophosphatase
MSINFISVNIKKLYANSKLPKYGRVGDAGLDLTAVSISKTDDYIEYGIGISLEIPSGFVGFIFPRSSISKYDLLLANSVGVIDSNFRGELKIRFKMIKARINNLEKIYNVGDKVAQLIIMPYPETVFVEVDKMGDTNRGEQGFGSSGI